jgi:choline dehydrogenase-like flavoprotein
MLDAGPAVDFTRDRELKMVYTLPYHGFGTPGLVPHVSNADEYNENVWVDERKNPYTCTDDDPYNWIRVRRVGGKTLFWGRASWRLSDFEFKCKDHDGFGDNWPIEYKQLKPYYDQVEPILRVTGRNEGWPQIPDGVLIPDDSPDSPASVRFKAAAAKRGIPATKERVATGQLASSINRMLPDALATGKLQIVSNAVVRQITRDRNTGLANGVIFVDRRSKQEFHAKARVIVVGASCLESTRILLNSGIGMSSGVLGHYLFDQFYVKDAVSTIVPEARGRSGITGGDGYIPRFRNLTTREKNFIRGYAIDFSSGGTPDPDYLPCYGQQLLKQLDELRGTVFRLTVMGEVLPRYENHVEIDQETKDAWGIPVLKICAKYGSNEIEMAKDAQAIGQELCHEAGFELLQSHWQMGPPGDSIHELGTCRMGRDPKRSVLNEWNQVHETKNVFVVDGSSFVSGGSQNPTLTICSLSMRACDHLVEQARRGDL